MSWRADFCIKKPQTEIESQHYSPRSGKEESYITRGHSPVLEVVSPVGRLPCKRSGKLPGSLVTVPHRLPHFLRPDIVLRASLPLLCWKSRPAFNSRIKPVPRDLHQFARAPTG